MGAKLFVVAEPPLVPLTLELKLGRDPRLKMPSERLRLVVDLALALEYLHVKGVVHRQVGLEHVFLRDAGQLVAKLGGLIPSRIVIRASREAASSAGAGGGVGPTEAGKTHVKTSRAVVPDMEALNRERGEAVDPRTNDVFSFGVLATQMLVIDSGGVTEVDDGHTSGKQALTRTVAKIGQEALQLVVMKCMEKDHKYRMSASMAARALRMIAKGSTVGWFEPIRKDLSRTQPLVDGDLEPELPCEGAFDS